MTSDPFQHWIVPGFIALPQLQPADVAALATAGVRLLINNRPDGEAPGEPLSQAIAAAAQAVGITYCAIPVTALNMGAVEAMRAALAGASGPVAAFCRSGQRSAALWACARALEGAEPAALIASAGRAGFDLSGLASSLRALALSRAPAG
jgi:uncharacterized protein (TIGR01244 family)